MWPFNEKFTPGKDCFCQFLEEEERYWKFHSESLCHKERPDECKRVVKYSAVPHLHGKIEMPCPCKEYK